MAVFKFLFVLALAVPLAVFMWHYIDKLSDEFQKSVARDRGSGTAQRASAKAPDQDRRQKSQKRAERPAEPEKSGSKAAAAKQSAKSESKRARRRARRKKRELRNRETTR